MAPTAKRRKLDRNRVEEIAFDPSAREEYLTGFHKRKQARIKQAQELAVKKDKEARVQARREVGVVLLEEAGG
jgi:ribosomal RNA-processing protein 17